MHFCCIKLRTLKIIFLLILTISLLAININGYVPASVYFGASLRKVPIYYVNTEEARVAISFDAAWGADKTEKIMEICKEYNVKATFFLTGFWIEDYPEMVKKIDENGFEIGTHSSTHPDMTKLSNKLFCSSFSGKQSVFKFFKLSACLAQLISQVFKFILI